MEIPDIEEQAMDAVIAMNAAVQRVRLFPVSNPSTVDYIDKAFGAVSALFEKEVPFSVQKNDRGIWVCGQPLEEKKIRKAQVAAFLDLLFGFNIRSLTLDPRLDRAEFTAFLELLGEKPDGVAERGGLPAAAAEARIRHLLVDGEPVGEQAADVEPDRPLREAAVEPMLAVLESLLEGPDRDGVCRHLGHGIASKDDETVRIFLSRPMDGGFRRDLLDAVLDGIEDDRYVRLLAAVRRKREAVAASRAERKTALDAAWHNLIRSDRGRRRLESMNRGANHRIKSGMERLFKGDKTVFGDAEFLQALPDVIDRFLAKGNQKAVEGLIDRLSEGLLTEGPPVRAAAAPILTRTMDRLMADPAHEGLMLTLSYKLAGWVRAETEMSRAYKTACAQLRDAARRMMADDKFDASRHILKIFNFIHAGRVRKAPEMVEAAGKSLEEIADSQLVDPLLSDLDSSAEETRKQAADRLVLLGGGAMNQLLDRLGESGSRKERSRIIRVIYLMGKTALPKLEAAVDREAPWYYVRNLILLFGKVGTEAHLPRVSPFLDHPDPRVRREALNSIYNIGGREGRRLVLEALPQADDVLKLNIVGLLGAWREREAVYPLMKLLESDALVQSKLKNDLAERICNALAAIGAPEAVPLLREIAEEKKRGVFTAGKGFSEIVRAAAQAGIDAIGRKEATRRRDSAAAEPPPPEEERTQE